MKFIDSMWFIIGVLFMMKSTSLTASTYGHIPDDESICDNYVNINGKSNINQFSFYYNALPTNKDSDLTINIVKDKIEISIPIKKFEASNPLMYNDFLKMLKAADFPLIRIYFPVSQIKFPVQQSDASNPEIVITIAGVSKTYNIKCSVMYCSDRLFISGDKTIRLTDFDLKPPVKLNGLVKVQDEINVNFGFIITFTNTIYSTSIQ